MHRKSFHWLVLVLTSALLIACSMTAPAAPQAASSSAGADGRAFVIGAIPDQDPELLQRLYGQVADYLEIQLGVPVEYRPVTDYTAAVTAFKVGDLDMVWFGGLTGVQARLQVEGAQAIAQRDIDEEFHSVFIASSSSDIEPFEDIDGLVALQGHTFSFGSQSSTSGRLMPQYFLQQAGVSLDDFRGEAGFSGSHDATIKLVEAGSYDAGVLNEQVWLSRAEAGEVDLERVQVVWRTPAYYDYHWVIRPDVEDRYGAGFVDRVQATLLGLDGDVPEEKEILDLFRAERFIATQNSNYDQIEAVGRAVGMIQ
jgi:phosphonate transport system substrate-binding protein